MTHELLQNTEFKPDLLPYFCQSLLSTNDQQQLANAHTSLSAMFDFLLMLETPVWQFWLQFVNQAGFTQLFTTAKKNCNNIDSFAKLLKHIATSAKKSVEQIPLTDLFHLVFKVLIKLSNNDQLAEHEALPEHLDQAFGDLNTYPNTIHELVQLTKAGNLTVEKQANERILTTAANLPIISNPDRTRVLHDFMQQPQPVTRANKLLIFTAMSYVAAYEVGELKFEKAAAEAEKTCNELSAEDIKSILEQEIDELTAKQLALWIVALSKLAAAVLGQYPYYNQQLALATLILQRLDTEQSQMNTLKLASGEGKSLLIELSSIFFAMRTDKPVEVLLHKPNIAKREFTKIENLANFLGLKAGYIDSNAQATAFEDKQIRVAYIGDWQLAYYHLALTGEVKLPLLSDITVLVDEVDQVIQRDMMFRLARSMAGSLKIPIWILKIIYDYLAINFQL